MIKTNLLPILIYYLFSGFIFNVLFVKFSRKEILKWTDEKTAKLCPSIDIKWLTLNSVFVLYFGHVHFESLNLSLDHTFHFKEIFKGLIICSWLSLLVVLAKIDLQTNLLPDRLTLSLAVIGIIFSYFYEQISLMKSLSSAILGFTFIMLSIFFLIYSKNMFQKIRLNHWAPLLDGAIFV